MKHKLIIGLGNPDPEYEKTYHNIGFLFLDYINEQKSTWQKNNTDFEYLEKNEVAFIKPFTFMNNSGKAVVEALKKFSAKPEETLIVHDDSDITLENFKCSFGRNAAGHKGVESIITALKTKNFWRLRIGIRPEKEKVRQKATDLVLKKITPTNLKKLHEVFKKARTEVIQ